MIRKSLLLLLSAASILHAKEAQPLPPELKDYNLTEAPAPAVSLQKGDRLAICGDSITEQKQYSVLIETYITACLPALEITCRQFGWSGEKADGFLARIDNDVLRFKPTVATTCYGMNDFLYVPQNDEIADVYRKNQTKIAEKFKSVGARLVIGSSGIIDSVPHWVKNATGTQKDLNLSLANFRNVSIEVAEAEKVGFADVYRPMLLADLRAKTTFGADFKTSGKDGVHPGWAGQAIMAYAFLKGLGVDGDLGTITYDDAKKSASAENGHEVVSFENNEIKIRSTRLPFAPGSGPVDNDNSLRAGMALVPFDATLNRFILKITDHKSENYTITWGKTSKIFTAEQLHNGINLASEFQDNPLVAPFTKIREAVAEKQAFETNQIKELVHGEEGKKDMEGTFERSEKKRDELVQKLAGTVQPVEHTIKIEPSA